MTSPALPSASTVAAVAAGGAIGSTLRFAVGHAMRGLTSASGVPMGTLAVNVVGSLVLGWMLARAAAPASAFGSEAVRALLVVGVLGGFTTFSAFSGELLGFLQAAQTGRAFVYAIASVVLSVGAAAVGFALARGAA